MRGGFAIGLVGVGVMLSGCASPTTVTTPAAESTVPSAASTAAEMAEGEGSPGEIRWLDGTITTANPDAGSQFFRILSGVEGGSKAKVSLNALVTAGEVSEKDGTPVVKLTIDEVTVDKTGDESGPGYTNPDKATRVIELTDPLLLVFPTNVVSPTPQDFVKHLSDFDTPFAFYTVDGESVGAVQWYHP